jgi:hypothetical protein
MIKSMQAVLAAKCCPRSLDSVTPIGKNPPVIPFDNTSGPSNSRQITRKHFSRASKPRQHLISNQ